MVDHGLGRARAVEAPRLHFEDGVVYAEPGIASSGLEAAGGTIGAVRERNLFFGGVQAVERRPRTGELYGRR